MDSLTHIALHFGPLGCMVHGVTYDLAPDGWPKGIPLCPQCLREWVVKNAKSLERIANPPTIGIHVSEGAASKDRLR